MKLMQYPKQSLDSVAIKLKHTGKYSSKFVKEGIDGLSKSSVYKNLPGRTTK